MAHHSDSSVQLEAEATIRAAAAAELGVDLHPTELALATGTPVRVDGVTADESVIVEIFARQGTLKDGQRRKVGLDAFKLVTLGASRPGSRLIMVFADNDAATYALGKGWLADALKTWKVEVMVVELAPELRARILEAQEVQRDALSGPAA